MIRINKFYNDFDTQRFEENNKDYRTPFEIDRDRILHTPAFRRLQAKTQVFTAGEYDFYRTRLTHSLEVAQIGRSITNYLNRTSGFFNEIDFFIDPTLVEAICLAHDLGHPPFGHSGEKKLNEMMLNYGGFEGNAQTMRLLTETIHSGSPHRKGINPTRALMDGVAKYKELYSNSPDKQRFFLYDNQRSILEFILVDYDSVLGKFAPGSVNTFKSIECEIMDWADDIAYSVTDIVDGIRAGYLDERRVRQWFNEQENDYQAANQMHFNKVIGEITSGEIYRKVAFSLNEFIFGTSIQRRVPLAEIDSNRYSYSVFVQPEIRAESQFYKKLANDLIFLSPQIQQLEYKAEWMIEKLFLTFFEQSKKPDGMKILSDRYLKMVEAVDSDEEKARVITDYISGMTDKYAIRIFDRMFRPGYGSLADLV